MSLKAIYKTEEEIPEGLAEHYTEQADGSYKIKLEGGVKTQADIDRVKASLEKERDTNEELTKKLSKYPDDFDPDKWDKVKDIDPDNPPSGGKIDPKDEAAFNKAVSEAVREKERELKDKLDKEYEAKEEKLKEKETTLLERFKKDWIKQKLAEKYGFNDPKRLRWLLLDIETGELPDLKRAIDSIEVTEDNGDMRIVGGDLKDPDGALEVLERVASKDVVKDYKPASDNSGGGASNNGAASKSEANKLKKEDGSLNITAAGKMYRENPEKAKSLMRQAGFDPEKYFKE